MQHREQVAQFTSHDARDMVRALYAKFGAQFVVQTIVDRTQEICLQNQVLPTLQHEAWAALYRVLDAHEHP